MKKNKNHKIEKMIAPNIKDAVNKVLELSSQRKRKFVESLDLSVNLNIDAKQSDQSIRGSVILPNGSGKKVKVVVITADESKKQEALNSGAILAGFEDLVSKIESGFTDFDVCVATPDVMAKISKIAKVLGPRGLMPSPKNGTVTNDIEKAVTDSLKGKITFKNDKSGIIHCLVGKVSFQAEALNENISSVIKVIKDLKPESAKGKFVKKFHISSTMGPSIEIAVDSI